VRIPIAALSENLSKLSYGIKSWADVQKEFPAFEPPAKEGEDKE
jgi:hypothetical protein